MVPEVLRNELAGAPSKGDGVYLGLKSDSNTVLGSELKTAPEKRFEFWSWNFFSEGSLSGNCGDVFDDPNCNIISIRQKEKLIISKKKKKITHKAVVVKELAVRR